MNTRTFGLFFTFLGMCAIVVGLMFWSNPKYDENGRHLPSKHESGGAGLAMGGAVLVFFSIFMVDNN
jgi:hypothetical protein